MSGSILGWFVVRHQLVLTQAGSIFLNGTAINLQGAQAISDDGPVISRDCGAAKNPPDAPE